MIGSSLHILSARHVAGEADRSADKATVGRVMAAVGSGCTEATARRLLNACGQDEGKAIRLAQQALQVAAQ